MPFLAQVGSLEEVVGANSAGPSGMIWEVLLILGATLSVGMVLLVSFYVVRRRNRRRSGQKIYRSPLRGDEGASRSAKRRRRRKEGENRSATLAETGGLPPLKAPRSDRDETGPGEQLPKP